jgi:ATP-dependent DNA helicase RecG
MVIENAESYGLAQLHQLRGRVGRGEAASWCYLVTSGDDRPSRRLLELEKSSDGFHLAEVDLELRGPGEIYGSLQHGALDLRFATLTDTKLVHKAQVAVDEFLQNDGNMLKYKELSGIIAKYQQLTTLN